MKKDARGNSVHFCTKQCEIGRKIKSIGDELAGDQPIKGEKKSQRRFNH
ncbi:zinc-finger domain-containing protein [Anaerobacillus sp. HL2]|nr:zinc-finger domain-containing protein [Anaerobacillus sp. HL2]